MWRTSDSNQTGMTGFLLNAIRSRLRALSLAQFDNLAQKTRLSRLVVQRVKSTWQAYDCFFGLPRGRTVHSSPNRLAVFVTQLGSPKGRHGILDSRFWILDCGLKEHESHCPKRQRGEWFLVDSRHERIEGLPLLVFVAHVVEGTLKGKRQEMPTSVKPQGVDRPLPTFAICLMPTSVKPQGVEHPLPTYAFCLLPSSVKPKSVEHPERQKGAAGATRALVPRKREWPPMSHIAELYGTMILTPSLGDSHADHCDTADRSRNLDQDHHASEKWPLPRNRPLAP